MIAFRLRFHKIIHFEFWPSWVFYLPLVPFYFWRCLWNKSLTFPLRANPGIPMGGLLEAGKWEVLKQLSPEILPKTLFISVGIPWEKAFQLFEKEQFTFPVIVKPNMGERGLGVAVVHTRDALLAYHQNQKTDYLIQEFVDFPMEVGVFYSRLPSEKCGVVSSLTTKKFLTVLGDGTSSIKTLLAKQPRSAFQIESLRNRFGEEFLTEIPKKGERRLIEPIGNHCRGTKFINGNAIITPEITQTFEGIARQIDGFYYGRFDVKVASFEDLSSGKNLKIIEVNGINSEPTHIYDPDYQLIRAYRDVAWHWRRVEAIARELPPSGISFLAFLHQWKSYRKYQKSISNGTFR